MLRLVSNTAASERVAFSLVHARKRIDVPVRSVVHIGVSRKFSFVDTHGQLWTFPETGVLVHPAADISLHIFTFTQTIVERPLAIFVGEECLSQPVVREPICGDGRFRVSVSDLSDAEALAARMRCGTMKPRLRLV